MAYSRTITAVMLTNGRKDRCRDCVRSAALALKDHNSSIMLINNGSDEISLPDYIFGVPCSVIGMDSNEGIKAKNIPVNSNESEFLLMMDDDAYIDAESVDKMLDAFESDSSTAAVTFTVINSNGEEACLLPTVFHGCACGFRTSALREIGGYPEDYIYYGEEYYLSFRLYEAGYRIKSIGHPVFHARDNAGRNMDRIISLLIKNNINLWCQALPARHVLPAIKDTVKRYSLVARKEMAFCGFLKGLSLIPSAIISGLRTRRPISESTFRKIAMLDEVESICKTARERASNRITICGVGKFPSIWLHAFKRHGIEIESFADTNPCWSDQNIQGIPIENPIDASRFTLHASRSLFLTGLASTTEKNYWSEHLSTSGARRITPEVSSASGTFDLLRNRRLTLYKAA